MKNGWDLKITDYFGESVTLRPKLELYSVTDFMGKEMPGLAVELYRVEDASGTLEPYATLTTCFGEFISIKNSAYIDTNNCPFAEQLLGQNIAEATGLYKTSGFCKYPLWIFREEFLQKAGAEEYQIYSKAYDQYMSFYGEMEEEEEDLASNQEIHDNQPELSEPVTEGLQSPSL